MWRTYWALRSWIPKMQSQKIYAKEQIDEQNHFEILITVDFFI